MAFNYHIELRSKTGQLLEILKRDVLGLSWRYDAVGGCGECEIALRREFDGYGDIDLDYDVRIQQVADTERKISGSTFPMTFDFTLGGEIGQEGTPLPAQLPMQLTSFQNLRYSGFVRQIVAVFDDVESVRLKISGYSRYLEYVAVPDETYVSQDVGAIARSIIDEFVLPKTKILRTPSLELVQDTGISVSATGLRFDSSAFEALKILADIGGNVEWGVLPNREVFFVPRSTTVKQTWALGDRITFYEPEKNTDEVVHRVYLRGAGGFKATLVNSGGVTAGYEKERVILVPSITNAGDATLWGTAFFSRFGAPQFKGRLNLGAIEVERSGLSDFIERQPNQAMPPLGRFRIVGGPIFLKRGATLPVQLPAQLQAFTLGGTTDTSFRLNSISYTPINGGLSIDVELGEKGSALHDLLRAIDFKLSELRQVA